MKFNVYFIHILSVLRLLSQVFAKVVLNGNINAQNYNFYPGKPSIFYPRKKIIGNIDYTKVCSNYLIQYSCENPVKLCKWDMRSQKCIKM